MDDLLTKQLQPASFRGFSFLCPAESVSVTGRKIAVHDYPNSGKRYAQDLGPLPPEFPVIATISGNNFLQKALNFERVLNIKGPGQLVLPHQGTLEVVALPYGKDYSQKSVGVVTFTLKFTISNTNEVPAQAATSKEDVYQAGEEVRFATQERFQDNYTVPTDRNNVLTASGDYRSSVLDTIQDYTARTIIRNSKLQKITRDLQTNLTSMIRDPIQLSEKLISGNGSLKNGLFATLSILLSDVTNVFGGKKPSAQDVLSPISFGSELADNGTSLSVSKISLWPENTGTRINRNTNRLAMVESVRMNALILGYEVAANFDYITSDQIAAAIGTLEQAYNALFLSGDEDLLLGNDNNFKLLMDDLKNLCYSVLDKKAQQVYSIGTFEVKGTQSIMGIAYKLYAENLKTPEELQNVAEALVALNPSLNPLSFSGTINIFEIN